MDKAKILIVEDEGIVEELKQILYKLGYAVLSVVNSGEKAIKQARQLYPDLILMDVHLKGEMDGITAAQTIHDQMNVPIVFLTAFADVETVQRSKVAEPFGYVIKPFEERELHANIQMALYKYQMKQRIKESEERYHLLFDTMREGFALHEILCDDEGKPSDYRFLDVNVAFESITGLKRAAILGRTVLDVLPETEAYWIETYGNVALTGQSVQFENYSQALGKYFTVIAYSPQPRQFATIFIDITERKEAEVQMQWKATVDAALSSLYEPLVSPYSSIKDVAQKVLEQSQKLTCSAYGYVSVLESKTGDMIPPTFGGLEKSAALLAERPDFVFSSEDRGDYPALWGHALNTRKAFYTNSPKTHPASKGIPEEQFPIQLQRLLSVPVMLGETLAGQILLANSERDYTQRDLDAVQRLGEFYALAIQRMRYEEALTRSNADLEQFAYLISHDLQEPLRMVSSFLKLLRRTYAGQLGKEGQEFISYAVDGSARMKAMILDLLEYSRISTRGHPLAPTDCESVLETALMNLKFTIAQSQAVITHDSLPQVMADSIQLTQVFQNLIANALKFQPQNTQRTEPPQVHISATKPDNMWRFAVQDNGIGIAPQDTKRIFQVFERLHLREKYPGTGIGLANCKKIVERHGGHIWVESQLGQGATFYFTMPACTASLSSA